MLLPYSIDMSIMLSCSVQIKCVEAHTAQCNQDRDSAVLRLAEIRQRGWWALYLILFCILTLFCILDLSFHPCLFPSFLLSLLPSEASHLAPSSPLSLVSLFSSLLFPLPLSLVSSSSFLFSFSVQLPALPYSLFSWMFSSASFNFLYL